MKRTSASKIQSIEVPMDSLKPGDIIWTTFRGLLGVATVNNIDLAGSCMTVETLQDDSCMLAWGATDDSDSVIYTGKKMTAEWKKVPFKLVKVGDVVRLKHHGNLIQPATVVKIEVPGILQVDRQLPDGYDYIEPKASDEAYVTYAGEILAPRTEVHETKVHETKVHETKVHETFVVIANGTVLHSFPSKDEAITSATSLGDGAEVAQILGHVKITKEFIHAQ